MMEKEGVTIVQIGLIIL